MPIVRQDQPTAGNTVPANRGQTNLYFLGVGSDANTATEDFPAFTGTPNGTLIGHGISFSTANSPLTAAQVGTISLDRTTLVSTFDPIASLTIGQTVVYDLHVKDIVGWVGDYPSFGDLPTGQANGAIGWTGGNYYISDGTNWGNPSGNLTQSQWEAATGLTTPDMITDVFSSVTFTSQDAGGGTGTGTGTGTFERNDQSRTWAIGTSAGSQSQYTIGGQGNTQDAYNNGVTPVILSTVNDPANSGTEYAYNASASTETNSNGHGNLVRIATGSTFDQVEYQPSGNEVDGDSYVYNVVAIDNNGAGDVIFTTVTINISASGTGTGTGSIKSINATALAAMSSTISRLQAPFEIDLTPALNNPSGTGTLQTAAPYVNCSATDFSVNGNVLTCTKATGGDFNWDVEVV